MPPDGSRFNLRACKFENFPGGACSGVSFACSPRPPPQLFTCSAAPETDKLQIMFTFSCHSVSNFESTLPITVSCRAYSLMFLVLQIVTFVTGYLCFQLLLFTFVKPASSFCGICGCEKQWKCHPSRHDCQLPWLLCNNHTVQPQQQALPHIMVNPLHTLWKSRWIARAIVEQKVQIQPIS